MAIITIPPTLTLTAFRKYENSPYPPFSIGNATVVSGQLTRDNTVKRTKPIGNLLFAMGTERTVKSYVQSSGESVHNHRFNDGSIYTGPAGFWHVGHDTPASVTLPNLNWNEIDGAMRMEIKNENLNLSNAIAELPQTARMMVEIARRGLKTIRSIRSGRAFSDVVEFVRDSKNIRTTSKRAADLWLEYRYGIKPLVSDVAAGLELISGRLEQGVYRSAKVRKRYTYTVTGSPVYTAEQPPTTAYVECELTRTNKARWQVPSPGIKLAQELGFTNPASLLWEVTPFSFVVDWVIPVGDWLGSLDALIGVSDLKFQRGYKWTRLNRLAVGTAKAQGLLVDTYRSPVLTNLLLPRLEYKPNLSIIKAITSAALLRQMIPSTREKRGHNRGVTYEMWNKELRS